MVLKDPSERKYVHYRDMSLLSERGETLLCGSCAFDSSSGSLSWASLCENDSRSAGSVQALRAPSSPTEEQPHLFSSFACESPPSACLGHSPAFTCVFHLEAAPENTAELERFAWSSPAGGFKTGIWSFSQDTATIGSCCPGSGFHASYAKTGEPHLCCREVEALP